jgi:Coenzyme PQQ synthesis protein D (PqqD)
MTDLYQIKSADIMHETIDGEVVVINLDLGFYYSIDGTGASIWGQLEQGRSLDGLASMAARNFDGDPAQMRTAIEAFLSRLLEEGLVTLTTGAEPPLDGDSAPERTPWADPSLLKYTDMEQLLLLDPIHEVEDTGWPNVN